MSAPDEVPGAVLAADAAATAGTAAGEPAHGIATAGVATAGMANAGIAASGGAAVGPAVVGPAAPPAAGSCTPDPHVRSASQDIEPPPLAGSRGAMAGATDGAAVPGVAAAAAIVAASGAVYDATVPALRAPRSAPSGAIRPDPVPPGVSAPATRDATPPGAPPLRRHDRVWLVSDWPAAVRVPPHGTDAVALAEWLAAGRPLIAARPVSSDPVAGIRLGLALPGRRRVGLVVAAEAIRAVAPPLTLEEAAAVAPDNWREPLTGLAAALQGAGLAPRVFGSLAWHALACDGRNGRETGYLTSASDVDLLLFPRERAACATAGDILDRFAAACPAPRLDGEFILPDGGAVAWRELLAGADRLLVKHLDRLALRPAAELFDPLGQEAA